MLPFYPRRSTHFTNKRTALSTAAASSPVPHHSKRISMRPHRHDQQASKTDQHKAIHRRETVDGIAAGSRAA